MTEIFLKTLLLIGLLTNCNELFAQSYNIDRIAFTNFLIRMYNNAPFEGVRAVNDYDSAFLISVLALDKSKYKTESILHRVASVKAMAQASRYFNGSDITQDMIIHTSEKSDGTNDTEIIENIREHSVGYVKALEQLTNFTRSDGLQVFIYLTPLNIIDN
jgi:rRNA-processing protein FCF1